MELGHTTWGEAIYRAIGYHLSEGEVGDMFTHNGEVYEITRIIQEGDTRIVTAVPYVGKPITIRIGG